MTENTTTCPNWECKNQDPKYFNNKIVLIDKKKRIYDCRVCFQKFLIDEYGFTHQIKKEIPQFGGVTIKQAAKNFKKFQDAIKRPLCQVK